MSRVKYSDVKRRGYKLPWVAWVLNQRTLYVTIMAIGLAMITGIVYTGASAYQSLKKPPVDNSPYQKITPTTTMAGNWANDYVTKVSEGQPGWNVSKLTNPRQPVDFNTCKTLGLMAKTVISTYSSSSNDTTVSVNLYSPGTALVDFANYQNLFSKCTQIQSTQQGDPATSVVTYPGGAFFTYGDAIIFVENDTNNLSTLVDSYMKLATSTLSDSGCRNLVYPSTDATRSLYTDPKNYKGLINTETIKTTLNLSNIPNPVYNPLSNLEQMDQPEGPIPADFPKTPATVSMPTVPAPITGSAPAFDKMLNYQVEDPYGPGCGWAWTSLAAPTVNSALLKQQYISMKEKMQSEVDSAAGKFVNNKLNDSKNALTAMQEINEWNVYVQAMNAVYAKWNWLNTQRANIQQAWYTYVSNHNDWINFDNVKANAITDYNNQMNQCNVINKTHDEWVQRQNSGTPSATVNTAAPNAAPAAFLFSPTESKSPAATPTPTPTPTTPKPTPTSSSSSPSPTSTATPTPTPTSSTPTTPVDPEPPVCLTPPTKPAIVDQSKPAEPKPPTLPKDVTIPNSWSKPSKTPTVALIPSSTPTRTSTN